MDSTRFTFSSFDYPFEHVLKDVSKAMQGKRRVLYSFSHSDKQREMIEYNKEYYGRDLIGLSKMFSQISVREFARDVKRDR